MYRKVVTEIHKPNGSVLYNLTAFETGALAVLDRISSEQSGIYAWFRAYNFRTSPDEFADDLIEAIRAKKFQSRTAQISPYYEVDLRSKSYIPVAKEERIREALKNEDFLNSVKQALESSILFQTPLYIGKSNNLRARIKQHLGPISTLRERLDQAGIDIEKTYLLILPTTSQSGTTIDSSEEDQVDISDAPIGPEVLYEEIFSRLFNPSFTIRLG